MKKEKSGSGIDKFVCVDELFLDFLGKKKELSRFGRIPLISVNIRAVKRINEKLDCFRSTDVRPKNTQQSSQSSNLPKLNTKSSEEGQEKGRKIKNMTIVDGICPSIDIRNNVDSFSVLKYCHVIEGFLQIVLIENNTEADFENVTFPKLREITGYLLLYRVDGLKSLIKLFPNLEVIRGDILLTDYAFMIYEMKHLQEVRFIRASCKLFFCSTFCFFNFVFLNFTILSLHSIFSNNQINIPSGILIITICA